MLRFLAAVVLRLLANAVGLAVAAWPLLDGFTIETVTFIVVVVVFTAVIEVVLDPLIVQGWPCSTPRCSEAAWRSSRPLMGSSSPPSSRTA